MTPTKGTVLCRLSIEDIQQCARLLPCCQYIIQFCYAHWLSKTYKPVLLKFGKVNFFIMERYLRPFLLCLAVAHLRPTWLFTHASGVTVVTEVQTTAVEGENVQLTCTYHPHTSPQDFGFLTWEKNNTHLLTYECDGEQSCQLSPSTTPSRYALNVDMTSSGNLTIRGVTLEDEAFYKCAVFTSDLVPYSSNTALIVNVPPRGIVISDFWTSSYVNNSIVRIQVNQTYQMKCSTSADVKLVGSFIWESDGVPMVMADQVNEISTTDSRLVSSYRIVDVTPTLGDSGKTLRCIATHPSLAGYLVKTILLDIQDCPSSVMMHSCPTTVVAGESATLGCRSASTSPPSALYLRYEGVRVDNTTSDLESMVTEDGASVLTYTKTFNKLDNNKEFVCCIETTSMCEELCSTPCQPNVKYPPSNPQINWSIPRDSIAEGATTLEINCTADGNPMAPSHITWTKIDEGGSTDQRTGTLRFTSVSRQDAGLYRCTVDNGIPPSRSAPTKLIVLHGPNVTNKHNQRVHGNEGDAATLVCNAEAYPPPTITWFSPSNQTMSTSSREEITQSTLRQNDYSTLVTSLLHIRNVDPESNYGNYRCVATNDYGNDNFVISLSGLSKPAPPTNLHINTALTSGTTLDVAWRPGHDGGASQTFTVTSCLQGTAETCTVYRGIEEEEFTITDLQHYSWYTVSVFGMNDFGESDHSPSIRNSTAPFSPEEQGVRAVYDTKTGLVTINTEQNSQAIPDDICFHLEVKVLTGQREKTCLKVGGEFPIESDVSESQLWIVSCGRGVCSSANQVLFQKPVGESQSSSQGFTDITSLVAIVSGALVCVVVVIIVFAAWIWNKKRGTIMFHQHMSSRTLPRTPCGSPPSPTAIDPMDSPEYAGVGFCPVNSYTHPYATSTLLLSRTVDAASNPPCRKVSQKNGGLTSDAGQPMLVQVPGTYTTTLHQYIPMTPVIAITPENGGQDVSADKVAFPNASTCASDAKNNNSDTGSNVETSAPLVDVLPARCDPDKETAHYLVPRGTKPAVLDTDVVKISETTPALAAY